LSDQPTRGKSTHLTMMPTPMSKGPLAGLLVIDLTRVLAGPYCTMVLRDLGARVVKVERPVRGDDARAFPPFIEGSGDSGYFITVNRGKQSVVIDFKTGAGRDLLLSLIDRADVLVENFSPGTLERAGMNPIELASRNPRLVVARLSGYGQTGPDRDLPAYDITIQARAGLMALTGPEGGEPVKIGSAISDIAGGMFSAIAVLAALYERSLSGQGQIIDVALFDASVALLENSVVRRTLGGLDPKPLGQRHPSITPFDGFACADGTIVIAAGNNDMFVRIARALGHMEWCHDNRFRDNASRTEHHAQLKTAVESVLREYPVAHWLDVFRREQVPCARIQSIDDVLHDPQVMARGMMAVYRHAPSGREFEVVASPLQGFSRTREPTPLVAPDLGQHTDIVLTDVLGLSAERIAALRASGVLG
jgi:CoA:oxalate CoA-transferase